MGGQLGDDAQDVPAYIEVLQPLLVVLGIQDIPLSLVTAGLMGPKLPLSGLKLLPQHPGINSVHEGLSFTS